MVGLTKEKTLPYDRVLIGSPNGIRTRVTAVRGRRPRPLDDRAAKTPRHGLEPRFPEPESGALPAKLTGNGLIFLRFLAAKVSV